MVMIINIALAILLAYLIYKCLGSYGFWKTYAIVLVVDIICTIIEGGNITITSILANAIGDLIYVAICNWAFKRTKSFITFFLLAFLVRVLIVVIPTLIFGGVLMTLIAF